MAIAVAMYNDRGIGFAPQASYKWIGWPEPDRYTVKKTGRLADMS